MLRPFLIKNTPTQLFPVNIAKFLRTSFFIEHLWRLLLISDYIFEKLIYLQTDTTQDIRVAVN